MNEQMGHGPSFVRSHIFSLVASASVLAVAYTLCRRAINLTDEGYLLSQALDMVNGKVLYRDMDSFVTPGIWFLLAGLFNFTEPSVLATRLLSSAGYVVSLFIAFRIVDRLSSRGAAWAAVASLCVASVWAFPAWTLVFYSPFAILFALAGLERLLAWRERERALDLLLCGLWLGLSVVFKQNYGALALIGTGAALVALRIEKGEAITTAIATAMADSFRIAAGVVVAVLPVIAYFATEGALMDIYQSLVLHPFEFMGRQDIAYPALSRLWAETPLHNAEVLTYASYSLEEARHSGLLHLSVFGGAGGSDLLQRLHLLLFWFPLIGGAAGVVLALRPRESGRRVDGGLASVLLFAGFVFLGVFPRADFNHLMNVYQPVIVAAAVVLQRLFAGTKQPKSLLFRATQVLAGGVAVLYIGIAGWWYVHYLEAMNEPVGGPRGGVLVDRNERETIDYVVDAIRRDTSEGDAVLTLPALAMFNFLAARPMPGRFYNLYEHHIAHDEGMSVVEALEARDVDLVIAGAGNFFSDRVGFRVYASKLADHLRSHFKPERSMAGGRFHSLRRRAKPISLHDGIDLLDHCEFGDSDSLTGMPTAYSQEKLLFASLYQVRDGKRPNAKVVTSCRFEVPERAELVFALGYRQPMLVAPGAVIRAEIRLAKSEQDEPLFSHTFVVKRQVGLASSPPNEYRVDLRRFAGQELTLTFHARFKGQIQMRPFDLAGYALEWQAPRIEIRHERVLVVGIDGASMRVIEPMIRAGRLPHLASIARQGVSGTLRSAMPIVSPRLWTTIATGKQPKKHGILHWVHKAEDGGLQLFLGSDRLGPAIWNITSANGLTTGVINWLNSYPPEEIRGIVVSDFAIAGNRWSRELLFAGNSLPKGRVGNPVTYPVEWSSQFDRLSQEPPLLPMANPFEDNDAMPKWIDQQIPASSFRDDDIVVRAALAVEQEIHPDLLMVYLSGIDKMSHGLWGALEPADLYPDHLVFTPDERKATVAALEQYYVYTDQLIGKLIERYREDDLVMVVSDHGFEAQVMVFTLTGGHHTDVALDGVLFARGSGIAPADELPFTRIADITPTILAWFGIPPGSSMDGQIAKFLDVRTSPPTSRHEDISIERVGDEASAVEDAIIEQLRGLGYVE